jgi:hypothetical protein
LIGIKARRQAIALKGAVKRHEIRNFSFVLRSRSSALIGASAQPGSVGLITARNMLAGG